MGQGTGSRGALKAVEALYHAYLTGFILLLVSRAGERAAAEVVFRLFRQHQLTRFRPGLEKLGLDRLPHAVACAQYHYLSNKVGGVKVEYVRETDRKAWVRYPPPRWIWAGTAVCGIPSAVSRAVLHGWHGNNGVVLGNPRLGFVCTKQTVDGQPGLEGYYVEHDHDLAPEDRVRFAPGEECPPFDPAGAPVLASDAWPPERLAKVLRNYAMAYVATALPEAVAALGPAEGGRLAGQAARLIGMQYLDETAALLGDIAGGAEGLARYMTALGQAQGDDTQCVADGDGWTVRQTTWRLMAGHGRLPAEVFDAWNELWVGAAAAHDRFLRLEVTARRDFGDPDWAWRIRRR